MFAAYCPRHRRTVLMSLDDIDELRRRPDGFVIHFTCPCGFRGSQLQPR